MKTKRPDGSSLLESGEEDAKNEISAAFAALYLPLPQAGEFIQTRRGFLLAHEQRKRSETENSEPEHFRRTKGKRDRRQRWRQQYQRQ